MYDTKYRDSDVKVIDLINQCVSTNRRFYSLEVSPKNQLELDYHRLKCRPLFTAITWLGEENLSGDLASAPAIKLGMMVRQSSPVLHHITCRSLTRRHVDELLSLGVDNILALTGDCVGPGQEIENSSDLVKILREKGRRRVCIGVAGYPDVHPKAKSAEADLDCLKEKVKTGADFIITQITFSSQVFDKFLKSCQEADITVPIIPGVCLPKSYQQLETVLKLTGGSMSSVFEGCTDDETKFRAYMLTIAEKLVHQLLNLEGVTGIHFFTLNNFDLLEDLLLALERSGIQFQSQN